MKKNIRKITLEQLENITKKVVNEYFFVGGTVSDNVVNQYLATALWSTNDNSDESGGEPLDRNYDISDIDAASVKQARNDLTLFFQKAGNILVRYPDKEQVAHDFWLTRNGHGAGFRDGDYEEEYGDGDKLTDIAKKFGTVDLYVGDDGVIYGD